MYVGLWGFVVLIIVLLVVVFMGCFWSVGNERLILLIVKDGEYFFYWCGKFMEEF